LIGVLVFTFYQYNKPPIFFNSFELNKLENSKYKPDLALIKNEYDAAFTLKQKEIVKMNDALDSDNQIRIDAQRKVLQSADQKDKAIREKVVQLMEKNDVQANTKDNNYIFLSFVTQYLPKGLIGLLVAIIFLASMGSTASALNSLASTTVIDIYKRLIRKSGTDQEYLQASRLATIFWGVICIIMALYASKIGNLLEAVNILGSYIYGTILGVFLVAFYVKHVGGRAVFIAAISAEIAVIAIGQSDKVAYLWLCYLEY
jgi:SSS family solute:Na+ symporter